MALRVLGGDCIPAVMINLYSQCGAHCNVAHTKLTALNEVLFGQHLQWPWQAATEPGDDLGRINGPGQAALPITVTTAMR